MTYPNIITPAQAIASNTTPAQLRAVAKWNEENARGPARERRKRQAVLLRQVADALGAANGNVAVRAVA